MPLLLAYSLNFLGLGNLNICLIGSECSFNEKGNAGTSEDGVPAIQTCRF
jgi:hypothetical protein